MFVDVHLHGYFSKFHDGPIRVFADTIADAIAKVTVQLKGFRPNAINGRHRITVADANYKDLFDPLDRDEIHLVPQLAGGKGGGFMQILLGVALVGVGLFLGLGTALGGILLKVGALLVLGGLVQLLSPQPEENDDEKKTRYLGAPKNTVKIGTRIPILYGTHKVYGHYLSIDIDAKDVT